MRAKRQYLGIFTGIYVLLGKILLAKYQILWHIFFITGVSLVPLKC